MKKRDFMRIFVQRGMQTSAYSSADPSAYSSTETLNSTPNPTPSHRLLLWRIFFSLLLVLGVAVLYLPYLDAPKVFDDIYFFDRTYVSDFGAHFLPGFPRYWPYASFAHQTLLMGADTASLRLVNILLHCGCLLVLQALVVQLLAWASSSETLALENTGSVSLRFRHEWVAFGAVLPFALHPVAVYATVYLIQRTTLMATFFSLLMWFFVLKALDRRRGCWMGLAVICYYFAVYSKQHAVLVPMVAWALVFLYGGDLKTRRSPPSEIAEKPPVPACGTQASGAHWPLNQVTLILCFAACGVIALCATLSAASLLGSSYEPLLIYFREGADWHQKVFGLERMHWMSIITQCGLFFKYMALWIWADPSLMSVDMREVFREDIASPSAWLGVVAYLAFGGLALLLLWRGRAAPMRMLQHSQHSMDSRGKYAKHASFLGLMGLGMWVIWVLFPVELVSIRLQEIFVLYRSYLWMTGGVIVLAALGNRALSYPRMRYLLPLLVLPVIVMLAWGAHQRLSTFASDFALWNDAVRLNEQRAGERGPVMGEERAYSNRGVARAQRHDYPGALADQDAALALNPRYYFAHYARSVALGPLGHYKAALQAADAALALQPKFSAILLQRASLFEKLGRENDALHELEQACAMGDPNGCYRVHHHFHPHETYVFKP